MRGSISEKSFSMLAEIKAAFSWKKHAPVIANDAVNSFFLGGDLRVENLDPLPVDPSFFPDGWMTPLELRLLYNLGKHASGDFLEIGPWIGRSTTAIALGRRDAAPKVGTFDTVDFGFVSLKDFCEAMRVGMEYASTEEIARPILTMGGTTALLLENLQRRDLLKYVTSIIRGNSVEAPLRYSYGVIFCDATHSEYEIDVTGPVLSKIARPGTWLMCDDLHTHDNLVAALAKYVQFDFFVLLGHVDPANKAAIGRVKSTSLHAVK
jgi:hypothetical protein